MKQQSIWTDPMTILLVAILIIFILITVGVINIAEIIKMVSGASG